MDLIKKERKPRNDPVSISLFFLLLQRQDFKSSFDSDFERNLCFFFFCPPTLAQFEPTAP